MASTDSLDDNTKFAEKNNASFPILADPDKTLSAAYGVLSPSGFAGRITVYIGPSGTVERIDRGVNPRTAGDDLVVGLQALGVPVVSASE